MPWGDRTGPNGRGPRTGRRAGFCSGYNVPGYENSTVDDDEFGRDFRRGHGAGFGRGHGAGFGRGHGAGFGRGHGAGYGRGFGWGNARYGWDYDHESTNPAAYTEKNEIEFLERDINALKNELEILEARKKQILKNNENKKSNNP